MKRQTNEIGDFGIFNILLIGKNPREISIADNIKMTFADKEKVRNQCGFNIVSDIEEDAPSNSWFNEFIFEMNTNPCFTNIIIPDGGFERWMKSSPSRMEVLYMKHLLQALNCIIIDISEGEGIEQFDKDIPQLRFNDSVDFLDDICSKIDDIMTELSTVVGHLKLIRSLGGRRLSFLGDAFGVLSRKGYGRIVKSDYLRFDCPILFDEFCKLTKGMTFDEIDGTLFTRSSSSLAVFFKK